VWSGIPLIGLPVFGDQPQYASRAEKEEYALHLDWMTLTKDSLFNANQEIINNSQVGGT
jgi:glucuronosyltransferase